MGTFYHHVHGVIPVHTKTPPQPIPLKMDGTNAADKARHCFTIMPFGGYFDSYYESIYKPAIEAAGLTPRRADDIYAPTTIVHDIWNLTKQAELCLADLTGKNANVFYELGLAHALTKPVILVTESMDYVPFDLRSLRIISYDKNRHDWGADLQRKITAAITEVLASPLKSVVPAFLEVTDDSRKSVTLEQKELLEMKQQLAALHSQVAWMSEQTGLNDIAAMMHAAATARIRPGSISAEPVTLDFDRAPPGANAGA